jgi:hypothetical protein
MSARFSNGWASGHRIDDGLPEGRPQQRHSGTHQRGQLGDICIAVALVTFGVW